MCDMVSEELIIIFNIKTSLKDHLNNEYIFLIIVYEDLRYSF